MSDATVKLAETAEEVALQLLHMVMDAESKKTNALTGHGGYAMADRKYILDTYAECIIAVRRPYDRQKSQGRD